MKKILIVFILTIISLNSFSNIESDTTLINLYKLLDNKDIFVHEKEKKITEIKKMLETPNINDGQKYDINIKLYNEYKTFRSDSAIYFVKENLNIANKQRDNDRIAESKLTLASLFAVAGRYIEAVDLLKEMNSTDLPERLLVNYYDTYKLLYSYYSYNNPSEYTKKSDLYRDSLLSALNPQSNHYQIVFAEKLYDSNRLNEAKNILLDLLNKSETEDHERAVLAYALANIYKKEGNTLLEKKYFAVSATCDIKNTIKENASMQALASVLYQTGDIEHAYRCIKSSMEDAMFCNARLRAYEVSKIFPIIDSAYQDKITKQKEELQIFLVLVSILSLFLIIAVVYVYLQMKRLSRIRRELYRTNVKLNELNTDLQSSNNQLKDLNLELSEANKIKETYIGHFLDLCSMYISKLEKYQNTLNKKAVEKKLDELYKMLKSHDMIDNELKELFENFDNIFLHLYPNFVEEFNSLLIKEERFILKTNELLNTELRIFALIRLGITDSSKIANFLHYSANTIYNYRTRVRNKAAVPREEFESLVMRIGAISK